MCEILCCDVVVLFMMKFDVELLKIGVVGVLMYVL